MSIVTRSSDFMYYVIEPGDATRYQLIIGHTKESVIASLSPEGTLLSIPPGMCEDIARKIVEGVDPHDIGHIRYIQGKGYGNHTACVVGILMAYYLLWGYIEEDIVAAIGKWYQGDREILPAVFKEML